MLTCKDKMFKTDDEPDVIVSSEKVEAEAVNHLDELAMRIVDGNVTIKTIRDEPAPIEMNGFGGVKMRGPKKLVVEYYED